MIAGFVRFTSLEEGSFKNQRKIQIDFYQIYMVLRIEVD